jgi:tetratricopeptide (TPR) repeat protein
MIKKIIIVTIVVLMGFDSNAQSKYGPDSLSCLENRALYYENYKQKNYADALKPWRWAFKNCPRSTENIFKNGPKIIKARMKVDPENKSTYIDTLMMIYDQRIQYFGKEGYLLGLKGYELINIDKSRAKESLGYLQQSLEIDGNNSSVYAVVAYMKAIITLEKKGEKTKEDVVEAYALLSEIIDYNIVNETNASVNFNKYSEKIEGQFTPYANCEDLIAVFSVKFDPATNDTSFLTKVTSLLIDKDCSTHQLFFDASSRLYELEPSASSADKMAKMSITKGNSTAALEFSKKAIEMEEDANQKAIYYLGLADAYRNVGSYASARNAVYSALALRSGWGEAYINLGNIYIAGAKTCSDDDFEKSTVYWVAIDAFKQALHDEDTKVRAGKSINTYSKYFPKKEICFFNGLEAGKSHTVECWINKTTIVRTSD